MVLLGMTISPSKPLSCHLLALGLLRKVRFAIIGNIKEIEFVATAYVEVSTAKEDS